MHPILPHRLFVLNREKLSSLICKDSLAIVHSNDEMPRNGDQFFPYRQQSDLFYLTGINQQKTVLLLCPNHPVPKNREILVIQRPDPTQETWHGKKLTLHEAAEISGIENILFEDEMETCVQEMVQICDRIYVNLYENSRFSNEILSRDYRKMLELKTKFPLHRYERLQPLLVKLRLRKEPEEIQLIRYACEVTEKAFRNVLQKVKPGMFEFEIEAELSYVFRINRCEAHAFYPIVASGENACILHYNTNNSQLMDGHLLLLDFGAEFSNYASDCSRTLPINGRFTKRQRQLYDATLRVLKRTRAMMVKGSSIALLNKQIGKFWEEEHVNLGLYSMEDLRRQNISSPLYTRYFMHGVSHFMGLDVHDVGSRLENFESGMILTCEPGIYIKEEGTGIRLENNILITEEGPIDLMNHYPLEAEEIEEAMHTR